MPSTPTKSTASTVARKSSEVAETQRIKGNKKLPALSSKIPVAKTQRDMQQSELESSSHSSADSKRVWPPTPRDMFSYIDTTVFPLLAFTFCLSTVFPLLALAFCLSTVHGHGGPHDDDNNAKVDNFKGQKLLVISLDGFRHDFLDLYKPPTLLQLASEGVRSRSLTSSYITKTFPNHHSIATGLYEESHGIVASSMYDPLWDEHYNHCSNISCGKWFGGEPIWNTNELNNEPDGGHHVIQHEKSRLCRHGGVEHTKPARRASGSMYWPGGAAHINNMSITFSVNYASPNEPGYLNLSQRIDTVLSWFTHPTTPVNLAMLYCENPDRLSHEFGPESPEVREIVLEIDNQLKSLLNQLKEKDLDDEVNLIILSDHGFADTNGTLYLERCIANGTYEVVDNSPMMNIWPKGNRALAEELYANLSQCEGITAFWNDSDTLKDYHYSNNVRISPIIVMTDIPEDGSPAKLIRQHEFTDQNWTQKGNHGWNNTWEKMHALFIAKGPAFKNGVVHEPFENIHVYPLMCKVLGITCPQVNGSLSMVIDMLYVGPNNAIYTMQTVVLVALICALVAGVMVIGACKLLQMSSHPRNGAIHSRSYRLRTNGKRGFERSTVLETSDEEF